MSASTLLRPAAGPGPLPPPAARTEPAEPDRPGRAAGLRLSAVVAAGFPRRDEPLVGWPDQVVRDVLAEQGRAAELRAFVDRRGTSFRTMTEALLSRLPAGPGELDSVLLAYERPDLFNSDVCGFWLSHRLPGGPVPCSVSEQGPVAAFTALRIAAGLRRTGALPRGAALFVLDQNATTWRVDDPAAQRPDAGALLLLGGTTGPAVETLTEVGTGPGATPADALTAALAAARAAHPEVRVLVGRALADQLAGTPLTRTVHVAAPGSGGSGIWAALGPVERPVLVADSHAAGRRFHGCLLVPTADR